VKRRIGKRKGILSHWGERKEGPFAFISIKTQKYGFNEIRTAWGKETTDCPVVDRTCNNSLGKLLLAEGGSPSLALRRTALLLTNKALGGKDEEEKLPCISLPHGD